LLGVSNNESVHMQLRANFRAAVLKCFMNFGVWDFQWVMVLKVEKEWSIIRCRFGGWSLIKSHLWI
jgi:hypothetical protein